MKWQVGVVSCKLESMKFHSAEVRQLALAALERGEPRQVVSQLFEVPVGTLDRWRREFRQTGKNAPAPRGHKRAAFEAVDLPLLEAQLRAAPDATLEQQAALWRQNTGRPASRSSVQRALKRLGPRGWTRKKRVSGPVNVTKKPARNGGRTSGR